MKRKKDEYPIPESNRKRVQEMNRNIDKALEWKRQNPGKPFSEYLRSEDEPPTDSRK